MEREVGEGRGRRGIIVGGIVLSLLLGCNNGMAELEKRNQFLSSLANLGNEFLNVFTSFGDVFSSSLGFKAGAKKSEVGDYFKNIESSLSKTKTTLEKIVSDMKEKGNSNASGVETAVSKLVTETLDKIIDGAKIASSAVMGDTNPIANIDGQGSAGVAAQDESVKSLMEGIEKIVGVVLKDKGNPIGKHNAGDNNQAMDGNTPRTHNTADAGHLFANDNAGAGADAKKAAADAAKAIGAVTGADILRAISQGISGKAAKLAKNATANSNVADAASATDAEVAGGIALRAMAKGGKFANARDADVAIAVKGVAVSAVTKALDTLTVAIRKTIDEGLKVVKDAMKLDSESEKTVASSDKK